MKLRDAWLGRWAAAGAVLLGIAAGARALAPQEVLVVYNSAAANFDPAILAAYTNAHPGVSGVNAPRYFDLNNGSIAAADIAYSNFVSQIRDPIRTHIDAALGVTNRGGIKAIQLLKGVPHRILDPVPVTGSGGSVGDSSVDTQTEFLLSNNLQNASVDAELVLLWKNLDTGQTSAPLSSPSDQFILNPLFNSGSDFDSFSRTNISGAASLAPVYLFGAPFTNTALWNSSLTPGDMVLVARLDGNSTAAVTNAIARAQQTQVNPANSWALLDEDGVNNLDGTDFDSASNYLNNTSSNAWNVKFDKTANFVAASEFGGSNLVLYASYGVNHTDDAGQDNQNYIDGFSNKVAPGALFLSYESWNGRELNGLSDGSFPFTQETAADSIQAGFTFALGMVYEPFAFSVPDANVLARQWLDGGVTFFEAAYLSTFVLSGMNIALGDGLGVIELVPEPPGPMAGLLASAAAAVVARRIRQRNRRQ